MTYRAGPDVAWVVDAGPDPGPHPDRPAEASVVLARLPDGDPVVLADSAGAIWLAALGAPDAETVVRRVSEAEHVAVEAVGPDVEAFVATLLERGLLVRH